MRSVIGCGYVKSHLAKWSPDNGYYKLKSKAASVIQAYWRGYSAITDYKKLERVSLVYQSKLRGRTAKKTVGTVKSGCLFSMSDQFSQLKSFLRSASMSSTLVTSAPVVRDDLADRSENSEASSTDSDFTFPAPSSSSSVDNPTASSHCSRSINHRGQRSVEQ
ncbi:hypothetical protein Bca4012_031373 [Brassica carinata]|uniref:Uncharacterized protein n=1 Tax=Brassica carinata TaxID=52824 RepID=A0A8X7RGK4_BRACI|nr:myosin-16-like isoform X1 [Brassica napus]KAG2287810.1 hypothetical protein Bca52824_047414 [Brassica carinata]